jgi:hypothetical protein
VPRTELDEDGPGHSRSSPLLEISAKKQQTPESCKVRAASCEHAQLQKDTTGAEGLNGRRWNSLTNTALCTEHLA